MTDKLTKEHATRMVVALQRLQAWGDRSNSPRGGSNALSWGFAALQGLASDRLRADIGSARPVRRFHALRVITDPTSGRPKPPGAPPALSRPFRGPSQQARTVPPSLAAPRTMLPLLSFSALRRTLGSADPYERRVPAPPRATSGVWLPPSRRPPPTLPAHEAPERPWASPFKASLATAAPLSGPLPS
jgi:hypothetical protein